MKRNNKAFTISELIITFAIVMSISLGLFKIVDSYKNKQQRESYRKELNAYRDEILRVIEDDISLNKVKGIKRLDTVNGPDCQGYNQGIQIEFYNSANNKNLCYGNKINAEGKKTGIRYGNKFYEVPSKFVKFEDGIMINDSDKNIHTNAVSYELEGDEIVAYKKTKSILSININMLHQELKESERLNVIYMINTGSSRSTGACSGIRYNSNFIQLTTNKYNECGDIVFPIFKIKKGTVRVLVNNGTEDLKHIENITKQQNIDYLKLGSTVKLDQYAFKDADIKSLDIREASRVLTQTLSDFDTSNIDNLYIGSNIWNDSTNLTNAKKFSDHFSNISYLGFSDNEISDSPNTSSELQVGRLNLLNVISEKMILSNITSIGKYAFFNMGDTGTKKIILQDATSLESIGYKAFYASAAIEDSIHITSSVKSIGTGVFYGTGIKSLNLSNATNLETIGNNAFSHTNLAGTITIPNKVKTIDIYAFVSNQITGVNLSGATSLETIGDYAFNGNKIAGTVKIPSKVITIGEYAFHKSLITTLDLSGATSLQTIGSNSFKQNRITGTVKIPSNVVTIKSNALQSNQITAVNLNGATNLSRIEADAFSHNQIAGTIFIPSNVTYIGKYAFIDNRITTLNLGSASSLTTIGEASFEKNSISNSLTFPSRVSTIGPYAFKTNKLGTSVVIPASITSIGTSAFDSAFSNASSSTITIRRSSSGISLGSYWNGGVNVVYSP